MELKEILQQIAESNNELLKLYSLSSGDLEWFYNAFGEGDEDAEEYECELSTNEMFYEFARNPLPEYEDIFVTMSDLDPAPPFEYAPDDFEADEPEITMDQWLDHPDE